MYLLSAEQASRVKDGVTYTGRWVEHYCCVVSTTTALSRDQ